MGRASLIMVMSFSCMLLMIGTNISRVSVSGMENYTYYYSSQMAHAIAGSGMNMACRVLYEDPAWRSGYVEKEFSGGTFSVNIESIDFDSKLRVTSTGTFFGKVSVIVCVLKPSNFSKFAYYSVIESNIWWVTGDTVRGPMHTEGNLRVAGKPVFMQKVTSLGNIICNSNPNVDKPIFMGGYETGVSVTLPSDLNPLMAAASGGGVKFIGPTPLYITFLANGQVQWSHGANSGTSNLSTFAPNGVIYASGANVHVSGVLNGKVTLACDGNSGNGSIYIDGSIKYAHDPASGPSTDMLGLVAENDILISDNANNRGKSIDIHATMFSRNGGFMAENWSSRPVEGSVHLYGGVQNRNRSAVGTTSGNGTLKSGYHKDFQFDDRFMMDSPPYFPTTGNFEVVSWFE